MTNIYSKTDTEEQATPLFGRLAKYVAGVLAILEKGLGTGSGDGTTGKPDKRIIPTSSLVREKSSSISRKGKLKCFAFG